MAKVTLTLDTRKKQPIVKLLLTTTGKSTMITLGVRLERETQWQPLDPFGPVVEHSCKAAFNRILAARLAAANDVLAQLEIKGEVKLEELKSEILKRIDPEKADKNKKEKEEEEAISKSVYTAYMSVLKSHEPRESECDATGNIGRGVFVHGSRRKGTSWRTWEIYETTLRRIKEYCEEICIDRGIIKESDAKWECISNGGLPSDAATNYLRHLQFEDINEQWLDGWCDVMSEDMSVNSMSIHLRNLRHVCKWAFDHDVTSFYVWKRYRIPTEETDHRDLSPEKFRKIFLSSAPAINGSSPAKFYAWRDMCLLSFYLIGINLVDMWKLTPDNIDGDYLKYSRSKTGRRYKIKIEPEAMEIINRHRDKSGVKLFDWAVCDTHKWYAEDLNKKCLQRIDKDVTFYCLRHTWATWADHIGIDINTIALCLGHGKKTVTNVYVRPDQRKIDAANRKVIDYALSVLQLPEQKV